MGAIYGGDVCQAVVEAQWRRRPVAGRLYGAQFYRVFGCARHALPRGELDLAMLRASEARLRRWSGEGGRSHRDRIPSAWPVRVPIAP
jgi:beta-N-acetylhexosaminidase